MSELTRREAERALETLRDHWSATDRTWVMKLPIEERDLVLLLAGELGAVPTGEETK